MQLFIIGNGFDKGHGLATDYYDFRTYLERIYPEFLNAFEKHYDLYPGLGEYERRKLLWNEFEKNLANIDEDIIIENADDVKFGLDGGDIGIKDTMYCCLRDEFDYINFLAKYMKQWIRSIRIRNVVPKTSKISPNNNSTYITFNYTGVLERTYGIGGTNILHIHGSLRIKDGDPIIGHGNTKRIEAIKEKKAKAEDNFEEKTAAACEIIENYYETTFKDTHKRTNLLSYLTMKQIDQISVIGHSIAGVDMVYFQEIDNLTKHDAKWIIYYYGQGDKDLLRQRITECGINESRLKMVQSDNFYDL